ncbi:hypothetical protein EB72_19350 [Mycobacterium sp. SWH-M1]|nr:hypothetical protein EB72_19350 [Mycobacterium sp. SWH-M1]
MWEVYWYERGNKNGLVRLSNESEACYQLLGRLTYSRLLGGTLALREAYNSRSSPELSQSLTEWARAAGYTLTRDDHSRATILWSDPGGETRFYVRRRFDGDYVLTSSQRASFERFELAAPGLETLERHLFGLYGSYARSRKRLARLRSPNHPENVATGFRVTEKDAYDFCRLTDEEHRLIACAHGGSTGISTLVKLSHLVSHSLADIIASYEDPQGRPLFHV